MSNNPHTLHDEFPNDIEKLHEMKVSNTHFAKLLDDYDAINDKVHRAETRVDTVEELVENQWRKERSHIKDEIARMLAEG